MLTSKDYLDITRDLLAIYERIPNTVSKQRRGDHQLGKSILKCISAAAKIGESAEREEKGYAPASRKKKA